MQVRLFRPRVREEAIAAVTEVMRSGWLGMGPKVQEFEQAFAGFLGVRHAVAVNTCVSALHLAVKLLRLEKGAEVITSPITFVGANQVLLYEGLTPVFADVDPHTGNLTPASVAACLTDRTAAILLTHLTGYACDLDGLNQLARERRVPIIEDCAHACGAWYKGARIGASGNLCAFSFDAIKNLTTGDGGMLIVPDEAGDRRARTLRYMGLTKDAHTRIHAAAKSRPWDYDVPEPGHRYHMNDLAAAMGLVHLKYLDEENDRRRTLAARYRELLANIPGLTLLRHEPDRQSSHHLFCILAENRDALADKLARAGILVGVHYSRNDAFPIFRRAEVPHAARFAARVLSLPLHLDLTDEEFAYVAQTIREGW